MNLQFRTIQFLITLLLLAVVGSATAQNSGIFPAQSSRLQALVDAATSLTFQQFVGKKLLTNQLAVTLIDLRDADKPVRAGYRGEAQIYPASVVKLFYLVAAHRWMEDKKIEDTPELRRAMRDMIVESYNEATHYIVDVLTDTTSGPELSPPELKTWFDKRNAVNRYFATLGYTKVNANKKPWCEGPYGRETQASNAFQPNRNLLSTDDTARLVAEIATGKAVSARRCTEMLALMKRDPFRLEKDPDSQSKFSGPALPPGSKLWSKAGWTSTARHDAACVELPDGGKFVLVVFTENHAAEPGIIHAMVKTVVAGFPSAK